jgi:hypothetical protein
MKPEETKYKVVGYSTIILLILLFIKIILHYATTH